MVVKQVERKITKIGNSLGVTLPQEVLHHLKAQQGDDIRFKLEEDGSVSVKKFKELNLDVLTDIDQDFLDGLQDLFENYDDTLRNLADR
ncbi:AbrB/MazE/SpoVT family DNA-binding domain-containing protein [Oceanobacillus sp. CFH 90083]|uniref:AbrB/MazE/SpoVT family DNA-binding domain-containing protein n=1 Tax=Oceanobacillus sp. CFH 90083 TaxID=2592336 RepID=UPI00128E039E|nr:AbrB/MazE/SpoVT family DNA-binding domain-containing protein [Oceanobacillus sp. CFH 90083]